MKTKLDSSPQSLPPPIPYKTPAEIEQQKCRKCRKHFAETSVLSGRLKDA